MQRLSFAALATLLAATAAVADPTLSNGPISRLTGEWQGRSLCVTTLRPACTDETVVYRITLDAARPNGLKIDADKIVHGERQDMGELSCRFETTRQQLICPMGSSQWQFRWDGTMLFGGLLDPKEGAIRFVQVRKA